MDKEVSMAVELGVILVAISAVIGIIWFTVFMGQGIANDASTEATLIASSTEIGVLEDLKNKENVMPASAAYSILRTYSNIIPEYYCNNPECYHEDNPTGKINLVKNQPSLVNHLEGMVSMEVLDCVSGGYTVIIHHQKCDWFNKSYTKGNKCSGCNAKGW